MRRINSNLFKMQKAIPRSYRSLIGRVRYFRSSIDSFDKSVTIGDVTIPTAPHGSNRPDLIPEVQLRRREIHEIHKTLPQCHLSHLRWMLQKDLALHQDFLLLGSPELARDRRYLLFLYAALLGREVEYISLCRDTSEADLKQRKEVTNRGTTFINQAPVRAAVNGRLLILDGLEKAERNVLPTLNNLLENREMPLDDGSMLVSPSIFDEHNLDVSKANISGVSVHRVHPDFRVAALGSISPGEHVAFDPPLRSRFQARLVSAVPLEDILVSASAESNGLLDVAELRNLVQLVGDIPREVSLQSFHDAVKFLENHQLSIEPQAALNAVGINLCGDMIKADDVASPLKIHQNLHEAKTPAFIPTKTTKTIRDLIIGSFESGNIGVTCVGPKGCYKSSLARETARVCRAKVELFSLHADMSSRDLLMVRGTDIESGDTIWKDTALTKAVRNGTWVVLDGIDKLRSDTLSSLALLMEQGWLVLPDGTRILANPKFRCIALAHPPENRPWVASEIKSMFHWIEVNPLPTDELEEILLGLYPALDHNMLSKVLQLSERLDQVISASNSIKERESIILNLRKMKHICRRAEKRGYKSLAKVVHNTLMTSFMPDRQRRIVSKCMSECGISDVSGSENQSVQYSLDEDLLELCSRTPSNPLLVPNPRFEENPGQAQVMADILEAHSVGEKALLISGYQGVGKNRIVDFLLSKLNCEREYMQLHRDSTIQTLLATPSVEDGRLIFNDSPLVRAAKTGRILVLDEADKAPLEVVALLKCLLEDGQLTLPDGRTLCHSDDDEPDCVPIHPDFCIWTLTNPAGFPFHGNDLAREMADVFSCHHVPPMDIDSHKRILMSYGPFVEVSVIDKIVSIWEELRNTQENGIILYPFSIRESASVIKHLNAYPNDGIKGAIENVIAFDRLDFTLAKQLDEIFRSYGVSLLEEETSFYEQDLREGGLSTPRTRTSDPKHGKIDPDNQPHIGGNTWAGGTGGSDTAGLGGRGGPYRLDAGHTVHQITDEMKAEVSVEAQRRAKKMAKAVLEQKLQDLDMGRLDWDRYDSLRKQVDVQIQQLRNQLKDLKSRDDERVWLKRQSAGELDDSRLVDALSGERDVFKRRAKPQQSNSATSSLQTKPMTIKLVVDISASMYRFNGYDNRLQRLLEACLMIMEGLRHDQRFNLEITGHSGSSAKIPLVKCDTQLDEATQLRVLECMIANTQYAYPGDSTIEAIGSAVRMANEGDLVLVISDANLKRYQITVEDLDLLQSSNVHAHLIFIGSLGEEARDLAASIPNERAQVCFESSDLPVIIKKLVTNVLGLP